MLRVFHAFFRCAELLAQLLEALEMGLDESSDVVGDRVHWAFRRVLPEGEEGLVIA